MKAVARAREGEPARRRRAMTKAEMGCLLAAAPPGRALLYRVAAQTGLRRGELAALTWADLDLEGATVTVRAASAKNRKAAVLPLPPGTVEALAAARNGTPPEARVFAAVPRNEDALYRDLEAAGIARETPEGVLDFHALRNCYATSLARAGVSLAQAQKLMRHSTPVLTSNVYTRLELHDARAAAAKIDIGRIGADREAASGLSFKPATPASPPAKRADGDQGAKTTMTATLPNRGHDGAFPCTYGDARKSPTGAAKRYNATTYDPRARVAERQTQRIQNPPPARV